MSFGNFFPDQDKLDYIQKQLKPFVVLYLPCDFTNPPKEKYLMLAAEEEQLLMMVINSRVNDFIAKRPELNKCQISLTLKDNKFLKHNSFLNCSEVKCFDRAEVMQQLTKNFNRIKGNIAVNCHKLILKAVTDAKTIIPKHKIAILDTFNKTISP